MPLWQPPLTIGWRVSVGCHRSTGPSEAGDGYAPPRILSVSRRYSWSCLTGHNILSNSPGLRWAMPGMRIHWGAWSGNCVFARNPACGNRLTTNWSWTSPRVKRQVDTQSACRNDLLLAVASANKNLFWASAILGRWRHRWVYHSHRP